ncbi:MAG: hypothetical protein ABIY50_03080 [Ignavibacteria bacterium]
MYLVILWFSGLNIRKMRRLIIFIVLLFIFSCNKSSNPPAVNETMNETMNESSAEESDSNLTAEEIFSTSLVQEIAGVDDIDLQIYIEEQFYNLASKSDKVTLDRISSSIYLLCYVQGGAKKSFILQKYYDPVNDEFIFDKSVTDINASDIFLKK